MSLYLLSLINCSLFIIFTLTTFKFLRHTSDSQVMPAEWTREEDNLLLRILHRSHPGGLFTGLKETMSWKTIASFMNTEAPSLGIKRHYTEDSIKCRFHRHILPHLLRSPPEAQFVNAQDSSAASAPDANVHSTEACHGDTPHGEADTNFPGDNYDNDLVISDRLLTWREYIRDHPEEFDEANEDEGDGEGNDDGDDETACAKWANYDAALLKLAEEIVAQNKISEQGQETS